MSSPDVVKNFMGRVSTELKTEGYSELAGELLETRVENASRPFFEALINKMEPSEIWRRYAELIPALGSTAGVLAKAAVKASPLPAPAKEIIGQLIRASMTGAGESMMNALLGESDPAKLKLKVDGLESGEGKVVVSFLPGLSKMWLPIYKVGTTTPDEIDGVLLVPDANAMEDAQRYMNRRRQEMGMEVRETEGGADDDDEGGRGRGRGRGRRTRETRYREPTSPFKLMSFKDAKARFPPGTLSMGYGVEKLDAAAKAAAPAAPVLPPLTRLEKVAPGFGKIVTAAANGAVRSSDPKEFERGLRGLEKLDDASAKEFVADYAGRIVDGVEEISPAVMGKDAAGNDVVLKSAETEVVPVLPEAALKDLVLFIKIRTRSQTKPRERLEQAGERLVEDAGGFLKGIWESPWRNRLIIGVPLLLGFLFAMIIVLVAISGT
ncbi:hypothetical protein HYV73_03565 [Candidatus Uhrbacteria bacterium]|nr:hypothetical protein [Candidatus Uhrbacteria bacterium]